MKDNRRAKKLPDNERKIDRTEGSQCQYGGDGTTAKQRARKRNRKRAAKKRDERIVQE